MLDFDLAVLYGVETKALKRAVKRNLARFPGDFMFELTEEEFENLRYQSGASRWGGAQRWLRVDGRMQSVWRLPNIALGAMIFRVRDLCAS